MWYKALVLDTEFAQRRAQWVQILEDLIFELLTCELHAQVLTACTLCTLKSHNYNICFIYSSLHF